MQNFFKKWHVGLLGVSLIFLSQQGLAQIGDWYRSEGGRIRISLDANPLNAGVGEAHGLIEIELNKGWKTYWKNPGSSGFAPELKIVYLASESSGNKRRLDSDLLFPIFNAEIEEEGGGWTYGYSSRANLPFRVQIPAKNGKIFGQLLVGLCETICLPVHVDFSFDLSQKADFLTKGRIAAALETIPKAAHENYTIRNITQKGKKLFVTLVIPEEEFLDSKAPSLFVSAPNVHTQAIRGEKIGVNEFSYQFDIVSGQLAVGDKVDYIIAGIYTNISGVQVIE